MASAAASALPAAAAAAGKALPGAGLAAGAYGKFAWSYSRSLYLYDAEFRFDRMCAGYEFANAQQEQYRADLQMLTELTFRKMAVYTVIGTMGNAIYIAIFCAGRLGLHGPSPPVWLEGLFLTNIAGAFAFSGMGIWLAFHAMWRAKAACVHLNTRKIRLMIPSRKKLDDARKYANQWEHQKIRDLARVPYISDALGWKFSGEVPDHSDEEEERNLSDTEVVRGGRSSSAPPPGAQRDGRRRRGGKKRVPCWLAEEFEQERVGLQGSSGIATGRRDAAPLHFQLYAKAQKEWFAHDVYARVCMLYSFLCFFQGASFYGLGQIVVETRAFWPAFANNFVFMVLHFLMLQFDIVKPKEETKQTLPGCQYLGTAVIPLAAIAMALDFRVEYWQVTIQLTWFFIFIAYIFQIIYWCRLWELAQPKPTHPEERMGNPWWQSGWEVPPFFQHVLYFVSPPNRLATEKGQVDTVRELKEGYFQRSKVGKETQDHEHRGDDATRLDEQFDYLMCEAWASLDPSGQDKVRNLYHRFSQALERQKGTELQNKLGHIEAELRRIKADELHKGDKDDGYASSGSGSGSDGAYSASSKLSGSDHGSSGPPDNRRLHAAEPDYMRFSSASPPVLVSIIAGTMAGAWVFLTFGMVIDRIVGVQGLITAPHWAKPPMSRSSLYPWEYGTPLGLQVYSGDTPWTPEELYWHENHEPRPSGWMPHWMDFGHEGRRLSSTPPTAAALHKEGLRQALTNFFSVLPQPALAEELLQRKPTQAEAAALTSLEARYRPSGAGWRPRDVTWPGFFEPKLLACSPGKDGARHALAITPRGVAAAAQLGDDAAGEAEPFVLTGLSEYPPLLSASYAAGHNEGLMLVSKMGDLLHCPGARSGNQWACAPLADAPRRIPFAEGTRLAATAAAWLQGESAPRLHVAVISESSPDLVALWVLEGNTEAASWLPLGELPVPYRATGTATSKPTLSFVNENELLLASPGGATIQRRISDGAVVKTTAEFASDEETKNTVQWQAACGVHGSHGDIVHLSLRTVAKSSTRRPEVMVLNMPSGGA